jgi:hypothetical protein
MKGGVYYKTDLPRSGILAGAKPKSQMSRKKKEK